MTMLTNDRDKKWLCTMLTTALLFLTMDPLIILIAHPISSLFWDWWYFSDSLGKYIHFTIRIRRITFLMAVGNGILAGFFWPEALVIAFLGTFYLGSGLVIGCALLLGFVKYPYKVRFSPQRRQTFEQAPVPHKVEIFNQPSFDMNNPLNTMGYYNPASPNYIFR